MSRIIANRYEIVDEIGRGGMAVVYRANDLRLNRQVALKLLHPFLATQTESAARFQREAEAIAKLHHKNIVEIFDTGQDDETESHFLVMELLEGVTLKDFISEHPTVIPEVAIAMCCSLCDALEHAHKANIIHRDVKPENIMFSKDGLIKLTDFGIARILDAEKMTASGSLIGSPAHMSPEIIEGHHYSFSCDIFSLGTVLYFALTNELPFQGTTPMAVFKTILDNNYPPPSRLNLSISRKIDRVVANCLKTDPAQRYQSMGELRSALLAILEPLKMTDYTGIVQAYFADSDAFNQSRLPEIKECLNASAQLAVRERRLPHALETLNTVLTYDPEDPQANALLKKLRSGDQIRKRIIIGASALIVLFLAIGIVLWVLNAAEPPETSTDTDNPLTAAPDEQPSPLVQIITDPNPEIASIIKPGHTAPPKDLPSEQTDSSRNQDPPQTDENKDNPDTPPAEADIKPSKPEKESTPDSKENTPDSRENTGSEPPQKTRSSQKTQGSAAKSQGSNNDNSSPEPPEENPIEASTPEVPEAPKQPELVTLIQPVFPPDGYAFISGKRYNANGNGDISLSLAPGTYTMTVTCKTRCIPVKTKLVVTPDLQNKSQEIVALEWADAHLTVNSGNSNLYFVAVRLDEQGHFTNQIEFLIPNSPKGFNGFNPLGNKPIKLEVFAISKSKKLTGMTRSILEKEKTTSTRVELLPGDTRTITL